MINIPKIPNLPSREELAYKEKALLIEILDQLRNTKKIWLLVLLAAIILAWPATAILKNRLTARFIGRQKPLQVATQVGHPDDLQIIAAEYLAASPGIYSVYAHVVNSDTKWSAWSFTYTFLIKDSRGETAKTVSGNSFVLPGSSRFLIEPAVALAEPPARVELELSEYRWTTRVPQFEHEFAVLQKQWGDENGKFFVEGTVKNAYSFNVKKITLEAQIFDVAQKRILAVNRTVVSDLGPFEQRYFRMFWPVSQNALLPQSFGQVQISAWVNPLEPGFAPPSATPIPAR